MSQKRVIYDFETSGHAHRVRLMAALLDLEVELKPVDLLAGEQKSPEFLSMNPFGQVPVLKDGDQIISDSTAILIYLAKKYGDTSWLPDDPVGAAEVQRFLSVASGEVFRGPCAARLNQVFGMDFDLQTAQAAAEQLLITLDGILAEREWLATDQRTIADIACYSYIAHAPEGGVSLEAYPHVRAWLERVEALPKFVGMPRTAV